MTGAARINSGDVLREVVAVRKEVMALTKLLIGVSDEPDTPGLVERVRTLEANGRIAKWIAGIIGAAVIVDVETRFVGLYRGGP
jgi:hypothetical protein